MKEIIKLIIKIFLFLNISKLTLSCTPSINTVSEINPFSSGVLVQITGSCCTGNTTDLEVLFNFNNQMLECYNINIDYYNYSKKFLLQCSFDYQKVSSLSISQSSFNFNNFYSVVINGLLTPGSFVGTNNQLSTPTTSIGITNYLFTNISCPKNCEKNGVCDIGNICRCNEGYASFDCSSPVYNITLDSPTRENNTVTFNDHNLDFFFTMSHVMATTVNIDNQPLQVFLSNVSLPYKNYNNNSWVNNIGYNVKYSGNVNEDTFSFLNYMGTYLPQSCTFASILINTTIDSEFPSLPSNIYNSTKGNGSFSLIFEISASNTPLNDLTWSISNSLNSIVVKSDSILLQVTISDLYNFNEKRVPNHAYLQVLSSFQAHQLQQYSSSSLYISLNFDQQSILSTDDTLSGTYTHKIIINAYSTLDHGIGLKPWQIALIIGSSIVFLMIFIVVLIIVCSRKRKHHYHLDENMPLYG